MNGQSNSATGKPRSVNPAIQTGRRSFIGVLIGLIWAAIGGTIASVAARFVAAPTANSPSSPEWSDLGKLRELVEGNPVKGAVLVKQDAGWALFNSLKSVWIVKSDQKIAVYSATCPHLGCTVDASKAGFACPCHGSSWDLKGQKLAGPTPRNLDVLESRIKGEKLEVKYQDFKQGISDKRPIG
jgi:quinol---cytochrome c reductase iron-sulfur subunit, bacillus type